MKQVCQAKEVPFVDLFAPTQKLYGRDPEEAHLDVAVRRVRDHGARDVRRLDAAVVGGPDFGDETELSLAFEEGLAIVVDTNPLQYDLLRRSASVIQTDAVPGRSLPPSAGGSVGVSAHAASHLRP